MEIQDVGSRAEEYKRELMKLYGKRTAEENVQQDENNDQKEDDTIYEEQDTGEPPEEGHDTAYYPYTVDNEAQQPDENVPGESVQEPGEYPVLEQASEEELGDSTGYILVNVRTGGEAFPIEGASVVITSVLDGSRFLIAVGMTDISGTTLKLSAPAPNEIYSQTPYPDKRPYSLFDVSVVADGFFRARSVDVPVFSGITSIQNFNMVPTPVGQEENETLTYYNQEPYFG
ncbi:MAG: hypothetical protein NC093_05655 [Alistipes sp.]|nr:hypothetical protein [Alistipes sp.]